MRLRFLAALGVLASSLALPSFAFALLSLTAGGFLFDVNETSTGALTNGTSNAYDTCYSLRVNGSVYFSSAPPLVSPDGRHILMPSRTVGGLTAQRYVYVPASGGTYVRYIDLVENPAATSTTATIEIVGNLGSDSTTFITSTSTGDAVLNTTDSWFSTDDSVDGGGATALAHVFQGGASPALRPTNVTVTGDNIAITYAGVVIPGNGRVAIMTFGVQAANRAASIAEARRIAQLPSDVLEGLVPESIANFDFGGAPFARITSPTTVNEGEGFTVDLEVFDLEGDTPSWSWDLDGDGAFGELPNVSSYSVPADTTDGASDITVAIETSDGTNTRIATRTVSIQNVAPTITSEPPMMASGGGYTYQVEADDPAGALDPLIFRLGGSPPPGMTISPSGLVSWLPPPQSRGLTYTTIVRVLDDDLGQDIQTWQIVVADNTEPEPATPQSPIDRVEVRADAPVTLVAENGTDPDGDALVYFFQISPTSSFEGGEVFGSGEVEEGVDTTSWTTAEPVPGGLWYWRVWVSDGQMSSLSRFGSFVVPDTESEVPDAGAPDAGASEDAGTGPPPPDGCGCRAGGQRVPPLFVFSFVIALILRRRGGAR